MLSKNMAPEVAAGTAAKKLADEGLRFMVMVFPDELGGNTTVMTNLEHDSLVQLLRIALWMIEQPKVH
jgi:hypothetical protein